jgi:hypothetical protein
MVNAFGLEIKYYHARPDVPEYTIVPVQNRDWKDRFYFFPIRLDEMNRNSLLVQNPLY